MIDVKLDFDSEKFLAWCGNKRIEGTRRAIANSLNMTAKELRKQAMDNARIASTIKTGGWNRRVKISFARNRGSMAIEDMRAEISVDSRSLNAYDFKTSKRKDGVTFKPFRSMKGLHLKSAFVAKINGHKKLAVTARTFKEGNIPKAKQRSFGRVKSGSSIFNRRRSKSKSFVWHELPIATLYGPSVASMVKFKKDVVIYRSQLYFNSTIEKQLEREWRNPYA